MIASFLTLNFRMPFSYLIRKLPWFAFSEKLKEQLNLSVYILCGDG